MEPKFTTRDEFEVACSEIGEYFAIDMPASKAAAS